MLGHVAQRCGGRVPEGVQGHAGWVPGQLNLVLNLVVSNSACCLVAHHVKCDISYCAVRERILFTLSG